MTSLNRKTPVYLVERVERLFYHWLCLVMVVSMMVIYAIILLVLSMIDEHQS